MSDLPRPQIQAKLTAMCRDISVAQDLDAGIQKELYGHMEDKLLAYVNGTEAVSEDDALILVREHFGNPRVVKELLGQVHAWEASVTVARRLAAVLILMFSVGAVFGIVWKTLYVLTAVAGLPPWIEYVCHLAWRVLDVVVMWVILRRWQRSIMNGEPLWFLTWSPIRLIGLMVLTHFLMMLWVTVHSGDDGVRGLVGDPSLYRGIRTFSLWAGFCAHGCLILWWCDCPPRRSRALAYGIAAWLIVQLIPNVLVPHPVNVLIVKDTVRLESGWKDVPGRPNTIVYRQAPSGLVVPVGHFATSDGAWNVSVEFDLMPVILKQGLVGFLWWVLFRAIMLPSVLLVLAYVGLRRWARRDAPS